MSRRAAARTLSQVGFVNFLHHLEAQIDLGARLVTCFHGELRSAVKYVGELTRLGSERQHQPVTKLEEDALAEEQQSSPVKEPSHVRDLFDLFLLFSFLGNTPWVAVMLLATTVMEVCGSDVPQRAAALQSVAQTFRSWDEEKKREAERLVKNSPSYLECNVLLGMGGVDNAGVQALAEILKMMPPDMAGLEKALVVSSDRQLYVVALVLTRFGVMDQGLFNLKSITDTPLASAAGALADLVVVAPAPLAVPGVPLIPGVVPGVVPGVPAASAMLAAPAAFDYQNERAGEVVAGARLTLTMRPNTNTVYHKLLKPFPTVAVDGVEDLRRCVVMVDIFKTEDGRVVEEPVPYLEGERTVEVKDRSAVFRKLKINTTTTSVGCTFVLRFSLMRKLDDSTTHPIAGAVVFSQALNVYSHTSYLKNDGAGGHHHAKAKESKKRRKESEDSE